MSAESQTHDTPPRGGGMPAVEPGQSSHDYWEAFYARGMSRWSGDPNGALVEEVSGLATGTALELACGQGGDAIWLAGQGWAVTATDVSESALAVAEEHAAAAGLGGRIAWEAHDLAASRPAGAFDLVTTSFLHSPIELPWQRILRGAAIEAVAPGGTLLVVGHAPSAAHSHADLLGPDELTAGLALPEGEWTVRTSELRTRVHAFRGAAPVERIDTVVRVQRTG
jgi:SAM-dependent methyltransferase